jgi:hypothetical protein
MERKTLVLVCLLVIALMVASAVPAGAKKPPKDPPPDEGGDGTSPTGTIYYHGEGFWTMDADGGNKQQLSAPYKGSISLTTHKDDHYWYVYFEQLTTTHPDGKYQTELRAVRDDGTGDRLLWYDSTMVYEEIWNKKICWMTDDAYISWATWKVDEDWTISDQGIYKATMSWGTDDNTPSLGTPQLVHATGTCYDDYSGEYWSSGIGPNWSADGSMLLYTDANDGKVLVDFSTTPPSETTYDYSGNHGISPDGTRMFFADGGDNIVVMDIDGGNSETIYSVEAKRNSDINFGWLFWSPDSDYIVFTQYVFSSQDLSYSGDIYTIGADGSDKAKLTKKTTTCDFFIPLAWR